MREVPANTDSFIQRFHGCPGRSRIFIAEPDMIVDEVANRLNPWPTKRFVIETVPCEIRKDVAFAVTARQ